MSTDLIAEDAERIHGGGGKLLFATTSARTNLDTRCTSIGGHTMDKVNLAEKFAKIPEYWKPHIAGELNGQMLNW